MVLQQLYRLLTVNFEQYALTLLRVWNDQNTTNNSYHNSYINKQRLMLPAMATTQAVKPHNETVRQRKKTLYLRVLRV
jgi:hypothetical protein